MLSNAKVMGSYRYKDIFQILPAPDHFPHAPCLEADHPCLLEIKYDFTFDENRKMPDGEIVSDWIQQKDMERKIITEIGALLGLFSLCKFVDPQDIHSWTIKVSDDNEIDTEWRQLTYYVKGHNHKTNSFSENHYAEMEKLETRKLYNFGARYMGSDFSIPDMLTELLDAYYSLEQPDRDAILRSASLFNTATKIKSISASVSFATFVSSIESIIEYQHRGVKIEHCKECNTPRYSVTRKFTDFLTKYSSDNTELIRFYKSAYGQRSKILHAGALFIGEHISSNWAESDWSSYHMNSGIERICRISISNWLLERHWLNSVPSTKPPHSSV